MKKFFVCKLCVFFFLGFAVLSEAETPIVGACKDFDIVVESEEVLSGVSFSHSGFWHKIKDGDEPFTRGVAQSADNQEFLATYKYCRQGIKTKECYYQWSGKIPRQRVKITLTMYRDKNICVATYSQSDLDSFLESERVERERKEKLAEYKRMFERRSETFIDECIFTLMPQNPNPLIAKSTQRLCHLLATRYAQSGIEDVRQFVRHGDSVSARLVCNIQDSWERSEKAFLESVARRCERFSETESEEILARYRISRIYSIGSLLNSPLLQFKGY